jgi:hypothetical protein
VPTCTLGKLREEELAESDPAVTPVPERETPGALDASLVTERYPVADPLDFGANATLNVVLWPVAKVSGNVKPVTLNPAPVTLACVIVTLEPPELVRVSDNV